MRTLGYCFGAKGLLEPDGQQVQRIFDSAFSEFGLPAAIRSDNGPPFASVGAEGLTKALPSRDAAYAERAQADASYRPRCARRRVRSCCGIQAPIVASDDSSCHSISSAES
jgi:hypothetical protein